jgi:hypothetical protein
MKLSETVFNKVEILESDRSKLPEAVLCRVVYPICNIGQLNANNRMYEKEVWTENVLKDEDLHKKMGSRTLFGQAEHPAETQSDLQLTSHVITKTWIDESDNRVYQEMDVLDTPTGRIVDTLLRAGCQVGVSTRAEGDLEEYELEESDGKKVACQRVLPESYRYVTTDFTADPSTFNVEPVTLERQVTPFLKKQMENKKAGQFAKLLYESIQKSEEEKVDEAHTSVVVTKDDGSTVSVEAEGDVDVSASSDGAVNVTPETELPPPLEPDVDLPPVEPEDIEPEDVGFEDEEDLDPALVADTEEEEEEERPFESKVDEVGDKEYTVNYDETKRHDNYGILKRKSGDKNQYAVVDLRSMKILGTWHNTEEKAKSYMQKQNNKETIVNSGEEGSGNEGCEESKKLKEKFGSPGELFEIYMHDLTNDAQARLRSFLAEKLDDMQWEAPIAHVPYPEYDIPESKKLYKELVDLKVQEASIRAERDALVENADDSNSGKLQIRMMTSKINEIKEKYEQELSSLRKMLEKKARSLSEAISKQKSDEEIEAEQAIQKRKIENIRDDALVEGRLLTLREYFDRRLTDTNLQVDENSRALLESCSTLGDVDDLMDRLIKSARRSALHATPLTEIREVSQKASIDPEQKKLNDTIGDLMRGF